MQQRSENYFTAKTVGNLILGPCCDKRTCSIKSSSAICRPTNGETCDLQETCDGESEWCKEDKHQPDGTPCFNKEDSYCYGGQCKSRTSQCQLIYGEDFVNAEPSCYEAHNWRGYYT